MTIIHRLHWVMLLIFLFAYGCTPSKRVVKDDDTQVVKADEKDTSPKIEVGEVKDITIDIDNKNNDSKPKGELPDIMPPASSYRDVYKVAMFLPLSSNEQDLRFFQYYAGMKIAAEQLAKEDVHIDFQVYSAGEMNQSNLRFENTHLIIAPNDENQLKTLIEIGKNIKTPVVSPFFSLSSVEQNPYYIQLRPSLRSHYQAMVKHMTSLHKVNEIAIIHRDTKADQSANKTIQSTAQNAYSTTSDQPITALLIREDSLIQKQYFASLIAMGKRIFIIPNYSYKDESYIVNLLKRLMAEKSNKQVFVYGMPILKESEKINSEYYSALNVRIVASKYKNEIQEDVKLFDQKFYDKFGALSDADAYDGYDNLMFLGRNIHRFGIEFQYYLSRDNSPYLQSSYEVLPYKIEAKNEHIDYFENTHLEILYYDGSAFIQSNDR